MAKTEDEQDQRIEDLKREAEKLSEGGMEVRELDDCPSEIEETFWKQVVEYEAAPWTTHFHQLEVAGVSLPPPDTLGDQELTKKLWEVIHVLALLHVFWSKRIISATENSTAIFGATVFWRRSRRCRRSQTQRGIFQCLAVVWPIEHGILNNGRFDPERKLNGAWYWYANAIKVPTLWSAAHAAGLSTASVSWPVTVNATDIDFDIPEYWRSAGPGDANNPDDRFLMEAVSRPDGELARIANRIQTPYMMGNDTTSAGDEARTQYSLDILKQHNPQFMTIHLSSLDEEEHLHGPFSNEANADLEGIDGMIGRLVAQEFANDPNAVIVIVSDHGFAPVEHAVNFAIPFLQAGLIQTAKTPSGAPTIASWQAKPWPAGCVTPIILHDPADTATRDKVAALLKTLAADPADGIEAVLDNQQTAALGGFPSAAFLITLKVGFCNGGALSGPLVTASPQKGAHGYNIATTPAMRSSLFLFGRGIAQQKDLGIVDMRQIAPTVAALLGIPMPSAKEQALAIY